MARLESIEDEVGNVDLCECEDAPSTRILRVIRRVKTVSIQDDDNNREYQAQYAYACGYYD